MIKAAIIGASGYAGGELVRLLARHPNVDLTFVSSETYAGKPLHTAFPGLNGTRVGRLPCEHGDIAQAAASADVVFLAQENGAAMRSAGIVLDAGKKVIDISADFRIRRLDLYEKWYKIEHTAPHLLAEAVYGLPERHREAITQARLVANPGCYPTATTLALLPLIQNGVISPSGIVVDAKSGVSGAGRARADLLYRFSEANESVLAYGVGGTHRHVPEIEQTLSDVAGADIVLTFTPHLIPMTRGILATCYAPLRENAWDMVSLHRLFVDAYTNCPFVVVRDSGEQPATKDVSGSNFCHIAVALDKRTKTVIVTSAIDNLMKGAAGQAVQNMNLMFGLPETAGLEGGGQWP